MHNTPVLIEFGGGAELLFNNKKLHDVLLPPMEKECMLHLMMVRVLLRDRILGDLLIWLKDNLLKQKPELFLQDKSVRPGILVLINDTDWELMDTINYVIQPNDRITFISTLHGG